MLCKCKLLSTLKRQLLIFRELLIFGQNLPIFVECVSMDTKHPQCQYLCNVTIEVSGAYKITINTDVFYFKGESPNAIASQQKYVTELLIIVIVLKSDLKIPRLFETNICLVLSVLKPKSVKSLPRYKNRICS